MSTPSSEAVEDVWVYHEKQMSSLCGQHCINNLVQTASYSAADLADIAHELDAAEREHMLSEGINTPDAIRFLAEESGNVDAAGNFSIQVLNAALKRLYGLHLVSAGSESVGGTLTTTGQGGEPAFVLNRHEHWVAIRSIGGVYWDLNSMLDSPARITTFALEATLYQLQADGYSVFVVRGDDLPAPAVQPGEGSRSSWYRVTDLLEASRGAAGKAVPTAETDVWENAGPARRLDGRTGPTKKEPTSRDGDFGSGSGSGMSSEDAQIAMAISASMRDDGDEEGKGDEDDDEVAQAIALSLAEEPSDVYKPQPVRSEEPAGPDVVRVQLRVGGDKKLIHRFSRADPVTALFDVAAHALAESDGLPLEAPFDLVAPGGRPLLKAGRVAGAEDGKEGNGGGAVGATIGSEQLGGASVLVRRAR